MTVSKEDITVCPKCGAPVHQDEDVLDTWFSSALWPFSVMGWPENTEDLKRFYPTNVLVTGYDIITFWVSRMIFSGLEHMNEKPFSTVFIHGLVRDAQGRKMSKSLGNGIDPLEIIDKFGADALRYALATGNSPGNDMRFSDEKIEAARNFNNKIWNASRFVLMNLDIEEVKLPDSNDLEIEDKWILSLYNKTVKEVCANLDNFELGIALAKLYDFIWDIFCDWYIELLKPRFNDKGSKSNLVAQNVITYVLSNTLKLLHPFMPFITEEIWQTLPHEGESIMVSDYPSYNEAFNFEKEEVIMDRLITAIRAIRNRRSEMNVPPSKKAALFIESSYADTYNTKTEAFFVKLASASSITYVDSYEDENAVQIITDSAKIYIPLGDLVDFEKEKERLNKEKAKTISEIERIEKKLSNEGFVAKAPQAVIDGEKAKLASYNEVLQGIEKALEKLN